MKGPKRIVPLLLLNVVLAPFARSFHPVEVLFERKLYRDDDNLLERESSRLMQAPDTFVSQPDTGAAKNRRLFFASTLLSTCALLGEPNAAIAAVGADVAPSADDSLPWQTNPVNKRSGITVFEAEKLGYNVAFATYLSRFLLNFDPNCQRWWFSSTRIPRGANAEEVEKIRLDQFAAFSASVEVGLLSFKGKEGARLLLQDLVERYGTTSRAEDSRTEGYGADASLQIQRRRARSARRQIALLFGLLGESTQPTKELTKLLASVDNGNVASVKLFNETFDGYEMGSEPLQAIFPPPQAGDDYEPAEGRAILKPTGKLLRIELDYPGSGYSIPPSVTIAPPLKGGTQAIGEAKLVSKGPSKGTVKSIQLLEPGSGYADDDIPQVTLSLPDLIGGTLATAYPVLNMMINQIEITKAGSGYAIEKPLKVSVHSPKRDAGGKEPTPSLVTVGEARVTAERSSFTALSRDSDRQQVYKLEKDFEKKYNMNLLSSSVSAVDSDLPSLLFWSERSTSAELLRLLPSGIGLEYDSASKRYVLSADTEFLSKYPAAVQLSLGRRINPEFGPRGRAPIERDMQLGFDAYLRFALSGAVCASGVHLALTPLDVVKTKVQTDPVKYPNILSSFGTIFNNEGIPTLFTGWLPTLLGNFVGGGILYAITEIVRRTLSEAAGVEATNLEVPIILTAAGVASALGAVIICPFEAVRIRTVAQPDYAANSGDVLQRMLKEEGVGSLVNAIPVFLVRNIPYAMTKFTIFDISTEKMYEAFPAAQEELKLSLLVSLIGGVLGGTAAAVISNPADVRQCFETIMLIELFYFSHHCPLLNAPVLPRLSLAS